MPGHRPNPYDGVADNLFQAMVQVDDHLTRLSEHVRPFDSHQLTPEEDDLLFHNPALRHIGKLDPATGLPLTNAQATQLLLNGGTVLDAATGQPEPVQGIGPEEYVAYVDDYVRRADRRNADAQTTPEGGMP